MQVASEIKATISPNPCSDVLTITAAEEISSVAVYEISGRAIMNDAANGNSTKLDMGGLATGLNFVKLTAKSGAVQTSNIVKEDLVLLIDHYCTANFLKFSLNWFEICTNGFYCFFCKCRK